MEVMTVEEMLKQQAREHQEKMRDLYAATLNAAAQAAKAFGEVRNPTWFERVRRVVWPWQELMRSLNRLSDTSEQCTDALCAALNELADSREANDGPASDELHAALKSLSQYDPASLRRMTRILDSGEKPFCACGECETCGISALLATVLDAIADEQCPELEPEDDDLTAAAGSSQSGESNRSENEQAAPPNS